MRADDDVVERHKRMIVRRWFVLPHIETGAGDLLLMEGLRQSLLVVDKAARSAPKPARGRAEATSEIGYDR